MLGLYRLEATDGGMESSVRGAFLELDNVAAGDELETAGLNHGRCECQRQKGSQSQEMHCAGNGWLLGGILVALLVWVVQARRELEMDNSVLFLSISMADPQYLSTSRLEDGDRRGQSTFLMWTL